MAALELRNREKMMIRSQSSLVPVAACSTDVVISV